MWRENCAIGQATDENMANAHCMMDTQGYRHALPKYVNTYCFYTVIMGVRTRLNVTLIVRTLPLLLISECYTREKLVAFIPTHPYLLRSGLNSILFTLRRPSITHILSTLFLNILETRSSCGTNSGSNFSNPKFFTKSLFLKPAVF